ncbi:transglutaminase family protein [Chitinophaga sp. SYP-B3965]|uniref:transglutaminase family protein n=1 Tax=Chitinophaga sp. SYP-B3965 TaxID=2663120 RepID=UPI001299B61E|nr:transglutaminase family protein [Chitinophaga sp. SYP-B3965]MRG44649.1 transglutaminase family protein [Chitinophaga sp. SYP-B3965]
MPTFKIQHTTKYEYDRPVSESMNEVKVFPYQCREQETLQHDIYITGQPEIATYTDYWGNKSGSFNLLQPHKFLSVESRLIIRTTASSQLEFNFHSGLGALKKETLGNLQLIELSHANHIASQADISKIAKIVSQESVGATVEKCSEYIFKNFKYIKGITNIETTVDEILEHRAGVCQDFAHLMLQILRSLQIPCRYVSGYICPNKNGMRGQGATHAWAEVWIPEFGWAGIDPTNNVWVTNKHVKLSVGRNFSDCSPVKGTFKGPAIQTLSVVVAVSYENGDVFEEVNKVHLPTQPYEPLEESGGGVFAGQQ